VTGALPFTLVALEAPPFDTLGVSGSSPSSSGPVSS
jgi:hypothetical protein